MAEKTIKKENTKKTEQKADKKSKKGLIIGCIVAAVVVIAAIVALVIINPFKKASMIGKYDLTGMTADGEDQSSTLAALKAFGITAELEIIDDKNGKISIFGQDSDFTYDGKQFHFEYDEEETDSEDDEDDEDDTSVAKDADYTFKDDKITIKSDENGEMIFTKKSE